MIDEDNCVLAAIALALPIFSWLSARLTTRL